ncbi:MAG TPA: hypothetical protein VGD91_24825 [Trebonia sp.]
MPFDAAGPTAVAITGVLAYSNGFEFFYTRIVNPDQRVIPRAANPSGFLLTRESFRLGVEFAGGHQTFPADVIQPRYDDEPNRPFLFPGERGTKGYRQDARWWVWPLPPPGKLKFICSLGETTTQVSMDAQLILDASQRSVQVGPGA